MRFTDIDVKFDVKYEGHQIGSKVLSMHTLRVFGYHHMWYQNWCQYVWTSLCQFIFCELSIVQVFDFSTTDIFLTNWHHLTFYCPITYVPHYSWEQGWWGIWAMWHVPLLDLHGGRVMGHISIRGRVMVHMGDGHMGDRAHCHNNA